MLTVKKVNLPDQLLSDKITICSLQLKSPFDDEMVKIAKRGFPIFGWLEDACQRRREKLRKILKDISGIGRKVDLLILPEYSISVEMVDDLVNYSNSERVIVLGNYYDDVSRSSTTAVILPNDEIHKTVKITRSPHDLDLLDELTEEESNIYRFIWKPFREINEVEMFFDIFTCIDFLNLARENLIENRVSTNAPGIIFVPMCSPDIDLFKNEAQSIMRRFPSIPTFLCNATDLKEKKYAICGGTQLVAPSKKQIQVLEMGEEGAIIAKLHIGKKVLDPTPLGQENVVVESAVKYLIERDGSIREELQRGIQKRYAVPHPHLFNRLGLSNYYIFYRVNNYYRSRKSLRRTKFGCHGVYGYQDLLVQSYEEDYKFARIRLHSALGPESIRDLEGEEVIKVNKTYKYRGKPFTEFNHEDKKFVDKLPDMSISLEYLVEKRFDLQAILQGKTTEGEIITKLKQGSALLEGFAASDVSEEKRNKGESEFLLLVFLVNAPPGIERHKVFERAIIVKLMEDKKIKTIEYSDQGGTGTLISAHYIIHIAGYLDDVRDIILDIQSKLSDYDIVCGTRVIPVMETLSFNEFESIVETRTTNWERDIIEILISFNRGENDPFVIKRVDKKTLNKLCHLYVNVKNWIEASSHKLKDHSREDLNRFIYGISYVIDANLDSEVLEKYCGRLYIALCREAEGFLNSLLQKKARGDFSRMNNKLEGLWKKLTKGKEDKKIKIEKDTALGTMTQCVLYWNISNENNKEDYILDHKFTEQVKEILGSKIIPFRNYFTHSGEIEKPTDALIENRDDVIALLNATDLLSCFLLKYRYGKDVN
jgi:hypothetical protein